MIYGPSEEQWTSVVAHFGCPECKTFSLYGPHVCEHGVRHCQPATINGNLITLGDLAQQYIDAH